MADPYKLEEAKANLEKQKAIIADNKPCVKISHHKAVIRELEQYIKELKNETA